MSPLVSWVSVVSSVSGVFQLDIGLTLRGLRSAFLAKPAAAPLKLLYGVLPAKPLKRNVRYQTREGAVLALRAETRTLTTGL